MKIKYKYRSTSIIIQACFYSLDEFFQVIKVNELVWYQIENQEKFFINNY